MNDKARQIPPPQRNQSNFMLFHMGIWFYFFFITLVHKHTYHINTLKRIYHCSGPLIGASPKSKRVNKKPVLIVPSPHGSFIFQRLQSTLKINHNFYLVAFYPPYKIPLPLYLLLYIDIYPHVIKALLHYRCHPISIFDFSSPLPGMIVRLFKSVHKIPKTLPPGGNIKIQT